MPTRFLLLRRLHLSNYKLHADTEVDLAARPILLITGANGSGKTQVLEALRLAMGVHPSPSRARGMASVVGPCGSEAKITLELINPVLDGHRLLKPPDADLARTLDHDLLRITTTVSQSGSVRYRVGPPEEGDGKRVSARQLRELLASVNVQAANRLAFTEEGVVDVFAGESGRKKLESLLEATGRLQYLEDLRQALVHLQDARSQTEPLEQKLKWERDLVASLRERLDMIRDRSKYLEQHAALCLEHAWAVVRDHEVERDRLLGRLERTTARLERIRASLRDAEDARRRAEEDIARRRKEAEETRKTIERERSTLERMVGERIRLQRDIAEATAELERYRAERDDLAAIVETEKGREEAATLKKRQHELVVLEAEMDRILRQVERLGEQAEAATADDLARARGPSAAMSRYELELLEAATAFQKAAADQGLARQIVGPVISLVGIRPGEEGWEAAVRCLAGRNLFAFVATSRSAYSRAKRLFDEIFPDRKPPLVVARHSPRPRQKRRPVEGVPGVHAYATDLLTGEELALAFLEKVVRGAVAHGNADPNELTDFAVEAGCPVLTSDCRSYFLPFGGFSRPPVPLLTPLGSALGASPGLEGHRLEGRQRQLLERHAELAVKARRLEAEIRKLGVRPQVVERLRYVEERIAALEASLEKMNKENERLLDRVKVLSTAINQMVAEEEPLTLGIDELEAAIRDADAERVRCQTLIAEEEKVVGRFTEELEAFEKQLATLRSDAEAIGPRPAEVRATEVVAREKNELKGKLDAIVGQTIDEDALRRKEEELDQLEAYMAERTAHIERLEADVNIRREVWQREVRSMVENLSRVMGMLLRGPAFRDVRLEVSHVEDPDKAELAIRARTKSARWLDYRELSGGEKVLCTEALIMALHTMSDSPVHAIDEFTQRLDKANAAAAFDIVRKTFEMTASRQRRLTPQFVLLCPEAFGLEDNELINHIVLVEARLRGRQRSRR